MQFPLREQIFSLKETKTLPLQGVDASLGVQVYIFVVQVYNFCGASI